MWIKLDVYPLVGAVSAAFVALSYATLHAATSYEDVEINVKKRENSLVDIENPEERENLGHKHIHSSLFRRAVERHDPQVYDHHTTDYKQPMIFPLGERLARLFSISK